MEGLQAPDRGDFSHATRSRFFNSVDTLVAFGKAMLKRSVAVALAPWLPLILLCREPDCQPG